MVELRDALEKNAKILTEIRTRLIKQQHGFVMTREDLVSIEIQLASMAYIAAKSQKEKEDLRRVL